MEQVNDYLTTLAESILALRDNEDIALAIQILQRARSRGSKVLILGNGGSATTAEHFACDLSKGTARPGQPSFRAMALTDNTALLTAYANDCGYDEAFVYQIETWVEPDDVVIAISGSGNSTNVLAAVERANALGALTIGLCGFSGGMLHNHVKLAIVTGGNCIEQAEDMHLVLEHAMCTVLRTGVQS